MRTGTHKKLFPAAAAALLGASVSLCVPVSAGEAGVISGAFLRFDPSPRATAMGEANTAITQDAYSAWWNPAGLAGIEVPEAAATYAASFADVTNQFAAVAYPIRYGSTVGLSINRQSLKPFQGYYADGYPVPGELLASDSAIAASYARTLLKDEIERPVFNVGASFKSVSETLDTAAGASMAFDVGAIYNLRPAKYWMSNVPRPELRVALALRNLGGGLKFDTQVFPLPQSTTLGLALITRPVPAHTLTLVLDLTSSNYDKFSFNAGAEYFLFQLFSLRGGYVSGQELGSGPRLGFGYRLSYLDVDYAVAPFGLLGTTQKFGVTFRYGTSRAKQPLTGATARSATGKLKASKEKLEALKIYANDYLEMAGRNIAAREYNLAAENVQKAFNLEPALADGPWGEKVARLNTLIGMLQLKETPVREKILQKNNEQSDTAAEAMAAYVEGKEQKAFLLAHAAVGADPHGPTLFEELLNGLSGLTRDPIRRDDLLPKVALIKEKLKRAAKSFYIQQFDAAVKECEEVVQLDEKNPLGWTRLGSAYYMSGDKAKARKAYEKVMELTPDDALTRKFMDSQGWKLPAQKQEGGPAGAVTP
ncbi:MAG TPA: PorV/PorQ family protein [Elusimicrobiales bacterium]|nr:PorV/PorQ family protein [Elusimicrobiales bacterium]